MKKLIAIFLAIALILTGTLPVFAASPTKETITSRFAYINWYAFDLEINESTGIAHCNAECLVDKNYTVEVSCFLERYDSSRWTTVKSWSSIGSRYAYVEEYWAVYSGYTYRLYVVFTVYDANGNLCEAVTENDTYIYPSRY